MSSGTRLIVITGATGFLGSAFCRALSGQGYRVRALVRDAGKAEGLAPYARGGIFPFDMPDNIDAAAFEGGIEAFIHCAWAHPVPNMTAAQAINIEALRRLLSLSRQSDVRRFVFVSTLSAHREAESIYGRSKLLAEALMDHDRDLIFRPGLVVGRGGLFFRMSASLGRVPVVPLFYGGRQQIQFIHVDDLCAAMQSAIGQGLTGKLNVAVAEPVGIDRFYRGMASSLGLKCRTLRLPGMPAYWLMRSCERFGVTLPVSSENLLGLKHMRVFDTASDLAKLGVEPAGWEATLARQSGHVRAGGLATRA